MVIMSFKMVNTSIHCHTDLSWYHIATMLVIVILYNILFITKPVHSFDFNDELYEVTAYNSHERSVLYEMYIMNNSIVFLNGVTNEAVMPIQVIVDKCCTKTFESMLQKEAIEYKKCGMISKR